MNNQELNYVREIVRVLGWRKNRGRHERKALAICRDLLGVSDFSATLSEARFDASQKQEAKKEVGNGTM